MDKNDGGPGQWLPIESAPTDGTYVLLFDAGYANPYLHAAWDRFGRGWWTQSTESGASVVWWSATHWMPLPPPPAKDQP